MEQDALATVQRKGRQELNVDFANGEWSYQVRSWVAQVSATAVPGLASHLPFAARGSAAAALISANTRGPPGRMAAPSSGPFANRDSRGGFAIRGQNDRNGYNAPARDSGYGSRGPPPRERERERDGTKMTRSSPSISWREAR